MAPPTWSVGQVLTAADVNNWFVPLAAYRTSSQSVTSSTTLVNDNQLFVTVAANAVYYLQLGLNYTAATAGDLAGGWALPSGASITNTVSMSLLSTAAGYGDDATSGGGSTVVAGGVGSGTNAGAKSDWILTTGGSSGTCQFQWAQLASFATATSVVAASFLILQRIG
jgi:hypothetical protein